MERRLLPIIFAISILLLMACASSQTEAVSTFAPVPTEFAGMTNPLGPEAATAGAEVFRANCELCHGPQGHGDGIAGQSLEPKPKDLADLQAIVGDDYLFWRIHEVHFQYVSYAMELLFIIAPNRRGESRAPSCWNPCTRF